MKTKVMQILVFSAALILIMNTGALAAEHSDHEHTSTFSWFSLVRPLGITTLSCLCATFLTGLFRRKLRARFLKIHLPLAIAAVALGLSHGLLIFILYG